VWKAFVAHACSVHEERRKLFKKKWKIERKAGSGTLSFHISALTARTNKEFRNFTERRTTKSFVAKDFHFSFENFISCLNSSYGSKVWRRQHDDDKHKRWHCEWGNVMKGKKNYAVAKWMRKIFSCHKSLQKHTHGYLWENMVGW
jgi:hypothetical protein